MGSVIQFPKKEHQITKPRTQEDLDKSIEDFRMSYILDVSEFLLNIIMTETDRAGFNLDDADINDVVLIGETIKSLMMKKNGYAHKLQDFAEVYEEFLTASEEGAIVEQD